METAMVVQATGWLMVGGTALRALWWLGANLLSRRHHQRLSHDLIAQVLAEAEKSVGAGRTQAPQARKPRQSQLPLHVVRREYETADHSVCSLYLAAPDGAPLKTYGPGQFLTVSFEGTDGRPLQRCYSLSEMPTRPQSCYRITVKRLEGQSNSNGGAWSGAASTQLVDNVRVGDVIGTAEPAGSFVLDQTSDRPVVLIAGGIGITPLMSMLNWLVASGSRREVVLIYAVRNREQHSFQEHIRRLQKLAPNLTTLVFYSQPTADCRHGIDFDHAGRIDVRALKPLLSARDFVYYMCGPTQMMASFRAVLLGLGINEADIHTEAFGGPSATSANSGTGKAQQATGAPRKSDRSRFKISFSDSKRRVVWEPHHGSLLDIAEACGVEARASCRAGQCGSCKVRLKSGKVTYTSPPAAAVEEGTCLPCLARPVSDLVVEL